MEYVELLLKKVCELELPLTLWRDDLHYLNIAKNKEEKLTIFDFESSAVGFGFLDSIYFARVCSRDEKGMSTDGYESLEAFMKSCAPEIRRKES